MKKLLIALAAVFITAASYGQGTVIFSNLGGGVNAPVLLQGTDHGPGTEYTAGLFLAGAAETATPLATSTFRAPGTGAQAVLDRYWTTVNDVAVPGTPAGGSASFIVRAWKTSAGSFAAGKAANEFGESAPVTVAALGGGLNPAANLTGLQGFQVSVVPEPTVLALGVLGASALLLRRRK